MQLDDSTGQRGQLTFSFLGAKVTLCMHIGFSGSCSYFNSLEASKKKDITPFQLKVHSENYSS